MDNSLHWLRAAFWMGIIQDAFMAVLMLFPQLFVKMMGINLEVTPELAYGLRFGVPLMLGWTALLVWGLLRPYERKDLLLLTLIPVIGYVIIQIVGIINGTETLFLSIPKFFMQALLIFLFIKGYTAARRMQIKIYHN